MRILLADDHALFRDGLRHLLAGLNRDIEILEARDFQETLDTISLHGDLDLLLLDLRMPGMTGLGSLKRLLAAAPALPIAVISASEDAEEMHEILETGIVGFVPKSESPAVMKHAIELVLDGGIYVPPALLRTSRNARHPLHEELTPRQQDVLRLIVAGHNNKEIARDLNLSVATVKAHLGAVFRALDVTTRVQAVIKAKRLGIFALHDER
ncbi:MAG: DNA-binding response regulator [Proteobacteria bacterium]|nr:MAG: DNA-binding response regulator [Pseudomonadota bacterium]QKK11953.1 MAG: response regulator transcription factor [Pseudomonadota bacterium]